MSLLPGRILPQIEPFGTLSEDGKTVIIAKNWWLLFYNMALQSIGTGTGIPADQLIDLESIDIDAVGTDAAALNAPLAALANLIPTEGDPAPSIQDVRNALLLAYSALDAVDAITSAFAAPSAKVGITAVTGTAQTAMRSDAAPALDLTMTVTWTGPHTFTPSGAVTAVTINAKSGQAGIQVNGNGGGAAARLASGATAVALFIDNAAQGVGTAAIRADSTATTGAKTASFTAANKPGTTNVTTPAQWIPVILDAVTYYVPAFAA